MSKQHIFITMFGALLMIVALCPNPASGQTASNKLPDWSGVWQMVGPTIFDAATVEPKNGRAGDPGVAAAIGYAAESGLSFRFGLVRNHYVGRTFIEPRQSIRSFGVRIKLNPVRDLINGKRVVLIDDSIVRGTTSKKIVRMVREAGAKEIHVRISCPPTISPCYYGVDTPNRSELIAAQMSVEEIRSFIEADSLGYLSLEGMIAASGVSADASCVACWNGQYPTRITRDAETMWERDHETVS